MYERERGRGHKTLTSLTDSLALIKLRFGVADSPAYLHSVNSLYIGLFDKQCVEHNGMMVSLSSV